MKLRNQSLRKGCVPALVALLCLSIWVVTAGCSPSNSTSTQSTSTPAGAGSTSTTAVIVPDATAESTATARSETHYSLYYANKELRKLTYLDAEYDAINTVYDRAARAWYKGQYYMDLVTCGEITQDSEIQQYRNKAVAYFAQATADATFVSQSLQP